MNRHLIKLCTLATILLMTGTESLFGLPALASTGTDGLVFSIANGTAEVTGYTGGAETVIIPKEAEGYPVTAIGNQAFKGLATLKEVSLHPAIVSIGEQAFSGCTGLERMTIPASVGSIGQYAFFGCTRISEINVDVGNAVYTSVSGALIEKAQGILLTCPAGIRESSFTVPSSVLRIGSAAFADCVSLSRIVIPQSIQAIDNWAFSDCPAIQSIDLPLNLNEIADHLFIRCENLKQITIPQRVNIIGEQAFAECRSLKEIALPPGLKSIGNGSFFNCASLEELTLPEGLTAIGTEAFAKCSGLKHLSLSSSLASIGKNAFFDCAMLEQVLISPSTTDIGEGAFSGCKALRDVNLPYGLKEIGYHFLWGCESLESIAIPATVTTIGEGAFIGCKGLTGLVIPDSIETIGELAFFNCSGLNSIELPQNVVALGKLAFYGCAGLSHIEVANGNQTFEGIDGVLFDKAKQLLHSYPAGKQGTEYIVPEGTLAVGDYAFAACLSLTEVTLPDGVAAVGEGAFYDCSNLQSVAVPTSLTSIGTDAFFGCQGLTLSGPQDAFANGWAQQNDIVYQVAAAPSPTENLNSQTQAGITLSQVGPNAVLVTWDGIPAAEEHYIGWSPEGNDFKYYERSINHALIVNDLIPGFTYDFYVGLDANFTIEPLYRASLKLREPEKFTQRDFQFRALAVYRCGAGQDFWSSYREMVIDCPASDFEESVYDYHIILSYDIGASHADTVFRQLNALITPSGRVFTTFNDVTYFKDALTNYALSTQINLLLDNCRIYQGGMIPGKYTILYFYNGQTIGEASFNVIE